MATVATGQQQRKETEVETLIYGIPAGETERYTEALLCTKASTKENIQKVLTMAKAAGYHSFRITTYNGEKPDFIKALSI